MTLSEDQLAEALTEQVLKDWEAEAKAESTVNAYYRDRARKTVTLISALRESQKKVQSLEGRVAQAEKLEREVEFLRRYGNKDCTAMADEALGEWEGQREAKE